MEVASWNIEGRLSPFALAGRRGSPDRVVRFIEQLNSDILILPEAFDGVRPVDPEIMDRLERYLDYTVVSVAYNDCGDRDFAAAADPHMMLLSRLEVKQVNPHRPADIRTMLTADIVDEHTGKTIRVFGIHLDDRSEESRLKQVEDLVACITESPYPVIATGDFNAMFGDGVPARVLRNKAVPLLHQFLSRRENTKIRYIGDILGRLSEMAIGETIRQFESGTGLVAADPVGRYTTTPKMRGLELMPSIRLAQIDHMYVSPGVTVTNFSVGRDGGSDHRSISATVSPSQTA